MKVRCVSCKRLKISCDEARPKCEYCAATNRECIYEAPKPRGRKGKNKGEVPGVRVDQSRIIVLNGGNERDRTRVDIGGGEETRRGEGSLKGVGGEERGIVGKGGGVEKCVKYVKCVNKNTETGKGSGGSGESRRGEGGELSDVSETEQPQNSVFDGSTFTPIFAAASSSFGDDTETSRTELSEPAEEMPIEEIDIFDVGSIVSKISPVSMDLSEPMDLSERMVHDIMDQYAAAQYTVSLVNRDQVSLNTMHKQLGITRFEYRLLREFDRIMLGNMAGEGESRTIVNELERFHGQLQRSYWKLWRVEVPKLWQWSSLLRQNIFSISFLFLDSEIDIRQMMVEDGERDGVQAVDGRETGERETVDRRETQKNLQVGKFLGKEQFVRQNIEQLTVTFFNSSLNSTIRAIEQLKVAGTNTNIDEAAELAVSVILLFTFLSLQPLQILPLISFNSEQDLVTMVKTMKGALMIAMPVLLGSQYEGILYLSESFGRPEIKQKYPIIEHLRDEFYKASNTSTSTYTSTYTSTDTSHSTTGYTPQQFAAISKALDMLEISFYRSIINQDNTPITRYIFLMEPCVHDLMEAKDSFCLKLLFYYSTLSVMTGMMVSECSASSLKDYIETYKRICFETAGGFLTQMDECVYDMATDGFRFTDDYNKLKMNPLKYRN